MLPSPSFDEGGQLVWDSVSLKLWQACPRKYKYTMIDGWRSQNLSVHLRFGQHYASALEHYHQHRAKGIEHAEAVKLVVREALEVTWDDGAPWDSGDNNKTRETLIRTIVWYLEHFKQDTCTTYILADGQPAVEQTFKIDLGFAIYGGHLDRVVTYNDELYWMDQKTSKSTISSYYFKQFSNDDQMLGYTFAAQMILGSPIRGGIIDAAQIAVGFSRFERGFAFFSQGQIDEWLADLEFNILEAREAYEENHFPARRTSCNDYGGCPFREVCSRDPSVRDNFLRADFTKQAPWNPAEAR